MNFSIVLCLFVVFLAALCDFAASAPKKYNFVPAKCMLHKTKKDVGGPLRVCTFPPKYTPLPQEDIDAVIEHISLNLHQ